MSTWTFERSGYVAGAAFPLLAITALIMNESGRGSWPGDIETNVVTTADLVDYYTVSTITRFSYLVLFAAVAALAWFVTSLRTRLQRAEGGDGTLARVAGTLGLLSALSFVILFAATAGADRYDAAAVDPGFLTALYAGETMLSALWFVAVLPMPFILAIAAYLGFQRRAVPRGLAWLAAVAASPGLIGALLWPLDSSSEGAFGGLVWIGQLAFLVWCLVAGIALGRQPERRTETTAMIADSAVPSAMAGV